MARASGSIDLPAPADEVWRLIGGFGSLPDWLPFIPKSELSEGGRVRRITTADGALIVERLETFDAAARRYSYSFIQSQFPVSKYLAVIRVLETEAGGRSRVEWSGEFTPDGVSDEEAVQLFQSIYDGGLKALADAFTTRNGETPASSPGS